jgi:hypothetical protein
MSTSATPVRLQLSRQKGFRLVSPNGLPIAIVDRRTKWGNPWTMRDRRDLAVAIFREEIERASGYVLLGKEAVTVADMRRELKGKNLACWCGPGGPCHADVLLDISNREE